MSTGKFIAGCVVGGVIGAIAGILLAPQSGEDTRENIKDLSRDVADRTDRKVKELQEKAENIISDIQTRGDELMEKLQNMVQREG